MAFVELSPIRKAQLRDVRRNPHLRKHRDEDERHKCPFGSGGYHNQIDKCRKQDKQDECGQRRPAQKKKAGPAPIIARHLSK